MKIILLFQTNPMQGHSFFLLFVVVMVAVALVARMA